MFDINKFGAYLSKLRKSKDMTQSEVGDKLNVSRQAVSKWELGESFPDVALLPEISALFGVSIDMFVNAGQPYLNEGEILKNVASGTPEKVADLLRDNKMSIDAVVNVAPVLKASTLDIIIKGFAQHGIDISHIVELATYMNDDTTANLIKNAAFEKLDEKLLAKFIPLLEHDSKQVIFEKILNQELSPSLLAIMYPYMDHDFTTLVEAAIMEGQLEVDVLKKL